MKYKSDSPAMAEIADLLTSQGYIRRYEVRGRKKYGGRVYRIAFAHPQKRIALLVGRPNAERTKILRSLGWRVIRL